MFPIFAGSNPSGYNLTRSLRFRKSATAYLSRTPSATTSGSFTISTWVKRGALDGATQTIQGSSPTGSVDFWIVYFNSSNAMVFEAYNAGSNLRFQLVTSQVFRDPSAWYHIVASYDLTTAKLYVNGAQVTALSTNTQNGGSLNNMVNGQETYIGLYRPAAALNFDGYQTEINYVTGQALTPSSFGSTNTLTGVWQPAAYTGSYGTNGFELQFTDNSAATAAAIGKDSSGNGNNWTPNNISVTAGVTYDSMTDVPTLTSATASNFATLNPLRPTGSGGFSNGNLTGTGETGAIVRGLCSTIVLPWTGKWYAEVVFASHPNNWCGVTANDFLAADINTAGQMSVLYYATTGNKWVNGTNSAYGASYTTETIGIAFDGAAGTITFYKSNVSQGAITLPSSTVQYVFCQANAAAAAIAANWNFGQRPFTYTPPTGFVALNTFNLPDSTIVKGNTVMDATLYTGTLLSNAITNAASFKPDLVWIKSRSAATSHKLTDSVRGVTKGLASNSSAAETTDTQGLTAFGSAGFTVGTDTNYNNLAATYVGWQWQAGQGSSSSNTNGTITSTVSVNASAGFSVVTWTGTGANATIGHGLGVAPQFIINKPRNAADNWPTWHTSLGALGYVYINLTNASVSLAAMWNSTLPTSSVFSVGTSSNINTSAQTMVSYCWTPIAGFSAFGSYTGNGSTDGPMIYTGFLPRWITIKRTDTAGDWYTIDTARNPYNYSNLFLFPNSSSAESAGTITWMDILSNGFKLRNTGINASGGTYIYMAFAENPTKYALAR